MSELEAIGDALTGGMLGRAVEPAADGTDLAPQLDATACLNCSTPIHRNFCGACGQKRKIHRTISAIGHELVHAILHLDGKLWRTLPLLAWRPGELTRRYIHGERARFVSPLAMFLFSVFLVFAVLQVVGHSVSSLEMTQPSQVRGGMDQLRGDLLAELAELRQKRVAASRNKPEADHEAVQEMAELDERIAKTRKEIVGLDELRSHAARLRFGDNEPTLRVGLGSLGGGDHIIEEFDRNPRLAFYKLQSNSYKFSWLLIPISVPFMWVLFFRRRSVRTYDHTIFVTYSMAFMSLLAALLTGMGFAGVHVAIISVAALVIPPIHIFRQLKHAYDLGWLGALGRTFALVGFCFVVATLYFLLLLTMGG